MFTKKIWFFAIVLLASFLITSNFSNLPKNSAVTSTQDRVEDRPIVIGYSNWAGWWPWAIAESEGLFAKHNLDVELKWYDDYSKSLEDLASGYIDANCQTLNDTISFTENAVKGEVVVLVNDNSAGNDKIIAAAGIEEVKDLKNKQVAVEAGVVDDFLLTLALDKAGINREELNIIDVETGAAVEAFAVKQVDAVGAFPPYWLKALNRQGAKEIVSSADFPGAIADLLVVTNELVDESPEIVQGLIATWFDVIDFMAQSPFLSDEIMATRAGVNRQQLELFKAGTKMFSLQDNLEAFSSGDNMKHLSYAAESITSFLERSLHTIEKKPNLNQMLNGSFIEAYSQRQ